MKPDQHPERQSRLGEKIAVTISLVGVMGTAGYFTSEIVKDSSKPAHAPIAPGARPTSPLVPPPTLAPSPSPTPTEVRGCLPSPKQDLLQSDIGKMVNKAVAAINAPHGKADASKVSQTDTGRNLIRHIGDAKVVLSVNRPSDKTQTNEQVGSIGVGYWPTPDNEAPTISILATRATATSPSQIEVTGQAPSAYDPNEMNPFDNILCADGSVYSQNAAGFTAKEGARTVHKWTKDIALVFSAAEAPGGVRSSPDLKMLPGPLKS